LVEKSQLDRTDAAEYGSENATPIVHFFDIVEHDIQGRVMMGI